MEIGEKIKKLRTEKLMTQKELAGPEITRNMLSRIENGAAQPSLDTLRYIAKKLNVSVSYLKKIFTKYAGLGVHKYFLKSKITIACRLLRRGMSVCEVSEKLSFSSHNYFSTVFKRETGRLPSEFRKEK